MRKTLLCSTILILAWLSLLSQGSLASEDWAVSTNRTKDGALWVVVEGLSGGISEIRLELDGEKLLTANTGGKWEARLGPIRKVRFPAMYSIKSNGPKKSTVFLGDPKTTQQEQKNLKAFLYDRLRETRRLYLTLAQWSQFLPAATNRVRGKDGKVPTWYRETYTASWADNEEWIVSESMGIIRQLDAYKKERFGNSYYDVDKAVRKMIRQMATWSREVRIELKANLMSRSIIPSSAPRHRKNLTTIVRSALHHIDAPYRGWDRADLGRLESGKLTTDSYTSAFMGFSISWPNGWRGNPSPIVPGQRMYITHESAASRFATIEIRDYPDDRTQADMIRRLEVDAWEDRTAYKRINGKSVEGQSTYLLAFESTEEGIHTRTSTVWVLQPSKGRMYGLLMQSPVSSWEEAKGDFQIMAESFKVTGGK